MIDNGNIYNLFDDKFWSYHLGSGTVGTNALMSKQTIGIEISNYGPLRLQDNNLIDAYGNAYCTLDDKEYYKQCTYRGYNYYATMTEKQELAVAKLLKYLCKEHDIPEIFKKDADTLFKDAASAKSFKGIYLHTSVRKDKFDWPYEMITVIVEKMKEKPVQKIEPLKICKDPAKEPKIINKIKVEPQPVVEKTTFEKIIEFIRGLFK